MDDKRICVGCEVEDDNVHMFKGSFYDKEIHDSVEEIYCNECLTNILTEEPEIISDLEAI